MTIYETEPVITRDGETRYQETRRSHSPARNGMFLEPLDFAALGVAALMTLGPLFAYAVGLGA